MVAAPGKLAGTVIAYGSITGQLQPQKALAMNDASAGIEA
jgi:hypothetical protein